jgi:hypothetical protein
MDDNFASQKENHQKRLSLPFGSEKNSYKGQLSNRRHTLVSTRGILKPNSDGNNSIIFPNTNLKEKRRVSFAPEVTLHKINYSKYTDEDHKLKRKNSLASKTQNQDISSKLSTSQYIGKVYPHDDIASTHPEIGNENNKSTNINTDNLDTPNKPQFVVDDDTQAMEMSIELTQQILKQQEAMKEQNFKYVEQENIPDTRNSLRDLFDEVENESNQNEEDEDQDAQSEVEMELTGTLKSIVPKMDLIDQTKDVSMELTQTTHFTSITNNQGNLNQIVIQQIDKEEKQDEEPVLNLTADLSISVPVDTVEDEETQTMEFTQPIQNVKSRIEDSVIETTQYSQMEFTEPIEYNARKTNEEGTTNVEHKEITGDKIEKEEHTETAETMEEEEEEEKEKEEEEEEEEEEPMEITQPISKNENNIADRLSEGSQVPPLSSDDKLSVLIEMSEPPTSVHSESKEYQENQVNEIAGILELQQPDIVAIVNFPKSASTDDVETKITTHNNFQTMDRDEFMNSSINDEKDSSEMETSLIGTEMIPLAEVTGDYTENQDYDSDNSFTDDNHVNVSLDVFLNDVNVQFFDNIGPTENEIEQTLEFHAGLRSPPSVSSPSTFSSVSNASTPSSNLSSKKSNLIDYIETCANIPYYHYIVHLINQYKSSIQSISTIVNTFSNDLLESNPTAIREYYQQLEDFKNELRTNYQAIASFTRKQAKFQNMRFVASLLEQLSSSYERANQLLEADLTKALEWRRGVLIERQQMIEKKVELDQYLQKLNALKDNWNSLNIEKIKKSNETLKNYRNDIEITKQQISETSKLLSSKNRSLIEKKRRREQLLMQIEELQSKVNRSTVPTVDELKILREKLLKLEKEKSIKLISMDDITLLIMNSLKVAFHKASNDEYTVNLTVEDVNKFQPFSVLIDNFLKNHQNQLLKGENIIEYIKSLVLIWKKFIKIWKDLLSISFLHSGNIDGNIFKFEVVVSTYLDFDQKKFEVEASLDDVMGSENPINVKLTTKNLVNSNTEYNKLLDELKVSFNNENSVINRLTVE